MTIAKHTHENKCTHKAHIRTISSQLTRYKTDLVHRNQNHQKYFNGPQG